MVVAILTRSKDRKRMMMMMMMTSIQYPVRIRKRLGVQARVIDKRGAVE
jgi:hypothetical protein